MIGLAGAIRPIPAEPEWIDLAAAPKLDRRAIRPEPENGTTGQVQCGGIAIRHRSGGGEVLGAHLEMAGVAEAMRRVNPILRAEAQTAYHPVSIAFPPKRAEENFALVTTVIAVGVREKPKIRDAEGDATIPVWENPGGDVEFIGEHRHPVIRGCRSPKAGLRHRKQD